MQVGRSTGLAALSGTISSANGRDKKPLSDRRPGKIQRGDSGGNRAALGAFWMHRKKDERAQEQIRAGCLQHYQKYRPVVRNKQFAPGIKEWR